MLHRDGGDEFLICVPGADLATGQSVIMRVRKSHLLAKTEGRNRAISWDATVTMGVRLSRLQIEDAKG